MIERELDVGITRQLARYGVATRYENLPAAVLHEARRALMNWAGCAVGASGHETVENAWRAMRPFAGPPQATLLGRQERTDVMHAALVNGIASHVLDFDDTHPDTLVHPSGPVASALFPLAEHRAVTGQELVNAFVTEVEVECRVARAVLPSHYDVGWHITSTAGVFGAAAASARLLQLDETQTVWALGLAATQASGLREMFGSMAKSLHPGRAAQNGLAAALLAQAGLTSSSTAIEGRCGFANVLSTTVDLAKCVAGLGERYELLGNTYKPFARGLVIHPVIDGCLRLRANGLRPQDVQSISLRVHPLVLELTGKAQPRSGLEGKFSVFHSAAIALIDGDGGQAQYADARVNDDMVISLRNKVRADVDSSIAIDAAHITVMLVDGTQRLMLVDHCVGSRDRPMTDSQLENKFLKQCEPILGASRTARALACLHRIETVENLKDTASTLAPEKIFF